MERENIAGIYQKLKVKLKQMIGYLIVTPDCSASHIYQEVEQGSFLIRKEVHSMKTSSGE